MLLALEIILTITAWRKGWRGWALLPLGLGVVLGLVIGSSAGVAGVRAEAVLGPCLIFDVLVIIALAVMAAKAPRKVIVSNAAPAVTGKEPAKKVQF